MNIALPEFQGRVAPVFDTCRKILIFSELNNFENSVRQEDWSSISKEMKILRLTQLETDILLCGAISCTMQNNILRRGIRIIAWLAGDISQILSAYHEGRIMDPEFAMPGTSICRQCRGSGTSLGLRRKQRNTTESGGNNAKIRRNRAGRT